MFLSNSVDMMKNLLLIISNVVEFIDSRYDGQQQQKEYLERNSKLAFFCLLHSNIVPFVKCQEKLTRQKLVESQLKIRINE